MLLETDTVEPEPHQEYKTTVFKAVSRMVAMEQTARCQIAIELYCLTKHVSHFLLLTMKIVKLGLFLSQNSV